MLESSLGPQGGTLIFYIYLGLAPFGGGGGQQIYFRYSFGLL